MWLLACQLFSAFGSNKKYKNIQNTKKREKCGLHVVVVRFCLTFPRSEYHWCVGGWVLRVKKLPKRIGRLLVGGQVVDGLTAERLIVGSQDRSYDW